MKFIRIFLLILIIIGLVALFTQNMWVPKLVDKIISYQPIPVVVEVKKINGPKQGTYDWCIANSGIDIVRDFNGPKSCNLNSRIYTQTGINNDKYFVITKAGIELESSFLVKHKISPNQTISCKYSKTDADFEIPGSAEYLLALEGNFLIIDRGTSPDPRSFVVYDLNNNKLVYTDNYFLTSVAIKNNTIDYWKPTDKEVSINNCSKLDEYKAEGFSAGIDSRVTLDLATLAKKELGEFRCTLRQ